MPWACASCGHDTARSRVTFDRLGVQVDEICPYCAPQQLDEAMRVPSDDKIYTGPQAFPKLYTRDREGMYHAKDELISDTAAGWDKGPTAEAVERKRNNRRTEPLTAIEKAAAEEWGEKVLAPAMRAALEHPQS